MRPKRLGMMLIAAVREDMEKAGLLNGLFMVGVLTFVEEGGCMRPNQADG